MMMVRSYGRKKTRLRISVMVVVGGIDMGVGMGVVMGSSIV